MAQIPYLIKSFRGGVSDENDKGVEGSFKNGEALNIHGRDDIITGKQAMSTVDGGLVTDLIQFFVPAADGSTYCFGNTGSIYVRSGDNDWSFAYNDENGAIRGAAEWQFDDATNYLFWATSTSIARKLIPGDTTLPWADATQDHKVEGISSTEWHTMNNMSGVLGIANGEDLATFSFGNDFNPFAVNLRPGNRIKSLEERDDYAILGSERLDQAEEGHIWSWITSATNFVQKKRIPAKGVNAIINAELMILQAGTDGELFFSDFVESVPIINIPGGGQVNPGGVTIEDNLALFGVYGGTNPGIWSYGRSKKNRPFALNYDYRLAQDVSGSTISTVGAIANISGVLLASWGTTDGSTSDYGVDQVNTTTKANAIYEGLEFDDGGPFLKKMFDTVKLTMTALATGTSISVRFKPDKATTGGASSAGAGWRYAVTGGNETTFSETDATEAIFMIGDVAKVYEVAVDLNASSNTSPEILSVTTYVSDQRYEY
ncbi:hypothetical protein CMI37_11725 [Candidatus Pacearchaeota archaeon]|nr:hypothetical protein [Candidatus Pacearchaeota archaeon]|tara:strand:- start:2577 stop:4040 length:1464 start_codon:yes stop_codon:yes gene_type:complete